MLARRKFKLEPDIYPMLYQNMYIIKKGVNFDLVHQAATTDQSINVESKLVQHILLVIFPELIR